VRLGWKASPYLFKHRLRLGFLGLIAACMLSACDATTFTEGPPAICTESGVQCKLAEGPLGVCERAPCPEGQASPCFKCTSQH
jgi:hypothetical protein